MPRHAASTLCLYDVIVVLGAAVWPGGQPSPALRRRVMHAVRLLRAGKGQRMLMTGGLGLHPPPEAHVMRDLAIAAGIRVECIVVEDQATSTLQSAIFCSRMLQQHNWSTALIVTDRYHLFRALMVFRNLGVRASGSAPEGAPYSRRFWKRCWYCGREVLACCWYAVLLVTMRLRRKECHTVPSDSRCLC